MTVREILFLVIIRKMKKNFFTLCVSNPFHSLNFLVLFFCFITLLVAIFPSFS